MHPCSAPECSLGLRPDPTGVCTCFEQRQLSDQLARARKANRGAVVEAALGGISWHEGGGVPPSSGASLRHAQRTLCPAHALCSLSVLASGAVAAPSHRTLLPCLCRLRSFDLCIGGIALADGKGRRVESSSSSRGTATSVSRDDVDMVVAPGESKRAAAVSRRMGPKRAKTEAVPVRPTALFVAAPPSRHATRGASSHQRPGSERDAGP